MRVQPASDYLLVRPIKEEQRGEFYVSEDDSEVNTGEIIACGPGYKEGSKISLVIYQVGQKVVFDSGIDYERVFIDGEEYLLVNQNCVLAVIKEDNGKNN